jgi:hypothetical protein
MHRAGNWSCAERMGSPGRLATAAGVARGRRRHPGCGRPEAPVNGHNTRIGRHRGRFAFGPNPPAFAAGAGSVLDPRRAGRPGRVDRSRDAAPAGPPRPAPGRSRPADGRLRSVGSRPAGRAISGVERSQGRWRSGAARAGSAPEKRAELPNNGRRPRPGSPDPLARPDPPVPRPAAGPPDPGRPDPNPARSAGDRSAVVTTGGPGDPAAGRGEACRTGRQ